MSGTLERIVAPTSVEPACPAGARVAEAPGGTGCVCRITQDLIDSRRNQSTLARFCYSEQGYQECPAWRADKRELWATKTLRDLLNSRGDRVSGHPEDGERNRGLELALEAQERAGWLTEKERSG